MDTSLEALLGGASGGFFYHLMALFAIETGLALSYGAYRSSKAMRDLALAWAWGLMLAFRAALLVPFLFSWLAQTDLSGLVGPLERTADVATVWLLVWGFAVAPRLSPRGMWVTLSSGLVVCIIPLALSLPAVGLLPFATWAWLLLGIALLGLGLSVRLADEPWCVRALLAVLALGVALQMLWGQAGGGVRRP